MRHTTDGRRSQRLMRANMESESGPQRRLRAALVELQRARCALHASCHAVSVAEADLDVKRQERDQIALQVAALADAVDALERTLASG